MSLNLDDRQRAMLAEMGVRVWWPHQATEPPPLTEKALVSIKHQDAIDHVAAGEYTERAISQNPADLSGRTLATAATQAASTAPTDQVQPTGVRISRHTAPKPTALTPLADGIADMDWPTLAQNVASCQACRMCLGRQSPVFVPPPQHLHCDWMVLGEPPDDAQERAGLPFVGDPGRLLDNMLRAVGVKRFVADQNLAALPDAGSGHSTTAPGNAYLSHALKCRPALPTMPDATALAACAHFLQREVALIKPKVILAMGRFAMQMLLSEAHPNGLKLPLGKLRGQVWRFQGTPVVITYPPEYLLRSGHDKARAWEDLCLAADVVQGTPST